MPNNMLSVQIFKPATTKISQAQNEYTIQEAYVALPNRPYPDRIEFFPRVKGGYPVGKYQVDVFNLLDVQKGRLVVADLQLQPVAEKVA